MVWLYTDEFVDVSDYVAPPTYVAERWNSSIRVGFLGRYGWLWRWFWSKFVWFTHASLLKKKDPVFIHMLIWRNYLACRDIGSSRRIWLTTWLGWESRHCRCVSLRRAQKRHFYIFQCWGKTSGCGRAYLRLGRSNTFPCARLGYLRGWMWLCIMGLKEGFWTIYWFGWRERTYRQVLYWPVCGVCFIQSWGFSGNFSSPLSLMSVYSLVCVMCCGSVKVLLTMDFATW